MLYGEREHDTHHPQMGRPWEQPLVDGTVVVLGSTAPTTLTWRRPRPPAPTLLERRGYRRVSALGIDDAYALGGEVSIPP